MRMEAYIRVLYGPVRLEMLKFLLQRMTNVKKDILYSQISSARLWLELGPTIGGLMRW